MKRAAILSCLFLFAATPAFAQRFGSLPKYSKRKMERVTRFLDLSAGVGYHTMRTDLEMGGDGRGRIGANAGVYYRNAFKPTLHFMTGVGASYFSTRSKYDNITTEQTLIHPDNGETYTLKTQFLQWEEIQKTINIEIPFGAYYAKFLNKSLWRMMVGGGARLEIPIVKKFKTDNAQTGKMTLSGYFPSTNVEYDDLENHGFYTRTEFSGKADTRAFGVSLFADFGFSYPVSANRFIYLGLYFSHGLLSMSKSSSTPLYSPDSQSYSGIFSSDLINKAFEMSVGFRGAYTFGF